MFSTCSIWAHGAAEASMPTSTTLISKDTQSGDKLRLDLQDQEDLIALSVQAKIGILARTIRMGTANYRGRPEDGERLYLSSEFTHRFPGFIMSLASRPEEFHHKASWTTRTLY